MPRLIASILFVICALQPVLSYGKTVEYDSYCLDTEHSPLRHTMILFDGSIMFGKAGDASGSNYWRIQLRRFINAAADEAKVYMAPGERVSVGMIMPDGSGVNIKFSGCMPILSKATIDENEQKETKLSWFLGGGWKRQYEESQKEFLNAAITSLALLVQEIDAVDQADKTRFAESTAAASLANFRGIDRHSGVPRIIIVTDLSLYAFPTGNADTVSNAGQTDALTNGTDLGFSEVHLLTEKSPSSNHVKQYLESYFLQGKSTLSSFVSGTGALNVSKPPVDVRTFIGELKFDPSYGIPMKFRLAVDKDNRLTNSWAQEIQVKDRFVPVKGNLLCPAEKPCRYFGDDKFAQIWNEHIEFGVDGEGRCPTENDRLPFMGFRTLAFSISDGVIEGTVSDEACYNAGFEDGGLHFRLEEFTDAKF